jgi:phosphate-selective porin
MSIKKTGLNKRIILLVIGLCVFICDYVQGQKISGYIQSQYQWGEKDATLKVGIPNENPTEAFDRIGIRRGRIKFIYEESLASGVFQLDITEKGVGFKDAYLQVKDPWFNSLALKAGVCDRPFGNEISYSSSLRESPERSTICQTLFPDERDLGVSLLLQAAKTSPWNFLKLEAGLFAGNGIKQETDSRKDFIGHLSMEKSIGNNLKIGGGVSYYNGSVYQGNETVFTMNGQTFVADNNPNNKGKFAKREYFGLDARFCLLSEAGMSQIRAEYLAGVQPGSASNSKSPNASALPNSDTYIRKFQGGYVIYIQDFGTTLFSFVLKYDWYNPNTQVKRNNIGLNATGVGDIASRTLGFGLLWRASNNIRMQAYYEINRNELTENITAYSKDLKNDVFTLRLQYKW